VAGHSSEELYGHAFRSRDLARVGLHLIDPSYHHRAGTHGFRYAVVQGRGIEVREGQTVETRRSDKLGVIA